MKNEIALDCLKLAITVAPKDDSSITIGGIEVSANTKNPEQIIEIAEIFYNWFNK